ncbi:MAG TPA: hypothetical protein VEU73_01855 [Gemmatimonadales bacterium]|nr:hypothetical protein [Gemmatimonadales bacterium]
MTIRVWCLWIAFSLLVATPELAMQVAAGGWTERRRGPLGVGVTLALDHRRAGLP